MVEVPYRVIGITLLTWHGKISGGEEETHIVNTPR